MPRSQGPLCARCEIGVLGAFGPSPICRSCRVRPLAFEAACAPWSYVGAVREAVRSFKYRHHRRIGQWLARDMAAWGSRCLPMDRIDLILPVPLHWLKERLRGFNPAAQLAEAVAEALRKPCESASLTRRRWTATQTALTWRARWRNVQDTFTANPHVIRGRSVLLIDDVLTSGATAHACSLALKDAGARRVYVLTAARTPRAPST